MIKHQFDLGCAKKTHSKHEKIGVRDYYLIITCRTVAHLVNDSKLENSTAALDIFQERYC